MTELVSRANWAQRICSAWQKSFHGIIECGQLISEAKEKLEHGEFELMVESDLPFSASTARRLMAIASDPRLANRAHVHVLPSSWGTLYEITKLPDDVFNEKIADGTINPEMQRQDVASLVSKINRQKRHEQIATAASEQKTPDLFGPFPLIYADPPWKFDTYSDKGLGRTPDQHYPTMTDEEIVNFRVSNKPVQQIAHDNAALLMWCTSSNLERALRVMSGWGFSYKSQAVWDKQVTGLGLVFRNQHEPLLYGTRGNMPGPQYQPPSIFKYPRGRHSAKPAEVRLEIEKMYPNFDAQTRLELFARETVDGWTAYGFESHNIAA